MLSFGSLLSLARMLVKYGPAPALVAIVGLQQVPDNMHGAQLERWWVIGLLLTLNKVLHAALTGHVYKCWFHHVPAAGLDSRLRGYQADELLALATTCIGHPGRKLFDALFCACMMHYTA